MEKFESDIRANYTKHGVKDYYKAVGNNYTNPHSDDIEKAMDIIFNGEAEFNATLDLSCGTGLITDILMEKGITDIIGCDPYLNKEYTENTTRDSISLSFNDIHQGKLFGRRYNTIVCSYALHLIEPSRLNQVLWNLCIVSDYLVLLSPNNKPFINDDDSYELIDQGKEGKCKYRVYKSRYANRPLKKK